MSKKRAPHQEVSIVRSSAAEYRIVQDRLFESDFDRMLKQIAAIQHPGSGDQ